MCWVRRCISTWEDSRSTSAGVRGSTWELGLAMWFGSGAVAAVGSGTDAVIGILDWRCGWDLGSALWWGCGTGVDWLGPCQHLRAEATRSGLFVCASTINHMAPRLSHSPGLASPAHAAIVPALVGLLKQLLLQASSSQAGISDPPRPPPPTNVSWANSATPAPRAISSTAAMASPSPSDPAAPVRDAPSPTASAPAASLPAQPTAFAAPIHRLQPPDNSCLAGHSQPPAPRSAPPLNPSNNATAPPSRDSRTTLPAILHTMTAPPQHLAQRRGGQRRRPSP